MKVMDNLMNLVSGYGVGHSAMGFLKMGFLNGFPDGALICREGCLKLSQVIKGLVPIHTMMMANRFPFKLNLLYTLFPLFLLGRDIFSVLASIRAIS